LGVEVEELGERRVVPECGVSLVTVVPDWAAGCWSEAAGGPAAERRMLERVGLGVITPGESNGVVIETMRARDSSQPGSD
jgi:hypothetical protein